MYGGALSAVWTEIPAGTVELRNRGGRGGIQMFRAAGPKDADTFYDVTGNYTRDRERSNALKHVENILASSKAELAILTHGDNTGCPNSRR